MASVIAWLQANWLQLVVALLAVDRLLIQLFPTNTILQSIQNVLSGVVPKPPAQ